MNRTNVSYATTLAFMNLMIAFLNAILYIVRLLAEERFGENVFVMSSIEDKHSELLKIHNQYQRAVEKDMDDFKRLQ